MKNSLDSIGLFIIQVKQHSESLTELLSFGLDKDRVSDLMERCIVSTNMLAGSTSVMGLEGWQDCLSIYETLLLRYRNSSLPWDEKIAQVISELIEKEELLVSAHEGGEIGDLNSIVSRDEIRVLMEEVNVILDVELPEQQTGGGAWASVDETREAYRAPHDEPVETADGDPVVDEGALLAGATASLRSTAVSLFEQLSGHEWNRGERSGALIEDIRRKLGLMDFYTCSMDEVLKQLQGMRHDPVTSPVESMRIVLEDYVHSLCLEKERCIEIVFRGTENELDTSLLFPVVQVLQWMIYDVFLRCDKPCLQVEIEATEKHGVLWWKFRDNGNNFIKSSEFDHEEVLAFYPSLKKVRQTLDSLESILWVELDDKDQTRFAFTTPASKELVRYMVWGEGEKSFSVLSTQVCSIVTKGDTTIETDSRGEHLLIEGRRVPLIKLELIYPDAPGDGDKIVVIGALEKRFSFYIDGDGRLEEGLRLKEAISIWKGISSGVAQLGQQRFPIIEAKELMDKYIGASEETCEDQISGGVVWNDKDLSQCQAAFEGDSSSPPETNVGGGAADVLVVERSNTIREALESVLSSAKFNVKIVERVEDAVEFIRNNNPRLIISEFRMPSMAAKVIVDVLNGEGKDIPVLVTTSHNGPNAQLLVEKLGITGYLSKPLDGDEVLTRVGAFFQGDNPSTR